MHFIAPDLLAEAHGLSVPVCITGLVLGLLLWLLGWYGHRFWVVLAATVAAGILGLYSGPDLGMQRLVAGLLLAVAAGALALALVRLAAFAVSGVIAWLIVRSFAPGWNDLQGQIICILAGGLVGLLFFRYWMMTVTSLLGTLLLAYSGLCLADRLGKLDAAVWSEQNALLLNWACAANVAAGLLVQVLLDRRRRRRKRDAAEEEDGEAEEPRERRPRRWLMWDGNGRRAG
jgi:hypothetical protein